MSMFSVNPSTFTAVETMFAPGHLLTSGNMLAQSPPGFIFPVNPSNVPNSSIGTAQRVEQTAPAIRWINAVPGTPQATTTVIPTPAWAFSAAAPTP